MGIYQQFPYSNFHDLNMDWFLCQWNKFRGEFDVLNHTVTESLAAFKDYLDHLDIYGTTKEILNTWLEDGTLENFFRTFLFPQRELIIARERRVLSTQSDPVGAQCCFYDGEYYYFAGNDIFNGGSVINKVANDNTVLETFHSNDIGHTNSITVTDDEIYIAAGDSNKIFILDKTDYSMKSVITDAQFTTIWGLSYNDGHMYVIGNDVNAPTTMLFFGELVDGSITKIHSIPVPGSTVRQNLCVFNSTIYILFNMSNIVYCYNLVDGELVDALYLPNGDGFFPVGEPEDLVIVNDRILLCGASYSQYDLSNIPLVVSQLFNTNILPSTIVQKNSRYSYMYSETRLLLTVDDTETPEINPTSTFTTIEEACLIANYHRTADIRCNHIDSGYLHLLNGHYTVVCNAGARLFNKFWFENSDVTVSQVVGVTDTHIVRCTVVLKRVAFTGDIEINQSNVLLVQPSFDTATSISSVRSEWKILGLATAVNGSLTISATLSQIEIFARKTDYMFLLLKIGTTGQGSMCIYMNSAAFVFGLTTTEINNGSFTRTIDGTTITYASGTLSGVDTAYYIECKSIS